MFALFLCFGALLGEKGPRILVFVANWKFLRLEHRTSTDTARRHDSCHRMIGLPPLEM